MSRLTVSGCGEVCVGEMLVDCSPAVRWVVPVIPNARRTFYREGLNIGTSGAWGGE